MNSSHVFNAVSGVVARSSVIAAALLLLSVCAQAQSDPVLRITVEPSDTTKCGTRECRSVTFENTSDQAMLLDSVGVAETPFSGFDLTGLLPMVIGPQRSRSFQWCYDAGSDRRTDQQVLPVTSHIIESLSIALVFDVSRSMDFSMGSGDLTPRLTVAKLAANRFIDRLNDTTYDSDQGSFAVGDEMAVIPFSGQPRLAQDFTTDKSALKSAVNGLSTSFFTCIFDALVDAFNLIATRTNPRKAIIIITDGDPQGNCQSTLADVLQSYQQTKVPVYTVGMVSDISNQGLQILQQIASSTGGEFFHALSADDLLQVYDSIATLLHQEPTEQAFTISGETVAPYCELSPTSIDFDTVLVGDTRCRTITVRNTGNAPLDVGSIALSSPDFSVESPDLTEIPPQGQRDVQVCFHPTRIRTITSDTAVTGSACAQPPIDIAFSGVGLDSVWIQLQGAAAAKPGATVELPVYLRHRLPAEYAVEDYAFTVTYNKTVVHPAEPFVDATGTLSDAMPTASYLTTYDGPIASTRVRVSGGLLRDGAPGSILTHLRFEVLLGDTVSTSIGLDSAWFTDDNPRAGAVGDGVVAIDSLCFIPQRLIDASQRYARITGLSTGSSGEPAVGLSIPQTTWIRLSLYDLLGRRVSVLADESMDAGTRSIALSTRALPAGDYFVVLDAGGRVETLRIAVGRP